MLKVHTGKGGKKSNISTSEYFKFGGVRVKVCEHPDRV